MQEVVDSIVATEQEARDLLSKALKNAETAKIQAEIDSRDLVNQAGKRTTVELRRRLDIARRRAEEEYRESHTLEEQKAETLYASLEPLVERLAKEAALTAMTTELER